MVNMKYILNIEKYLSNNIAGQFLSCTVVQKWSTEKYTMQYLLTLNAERIRPLVL